MPYVFDLDRLDRLAAEHCDAYRTADPYPHVVIDDFLDASAASELARVFPKPGDPVAWDHYAAPGLEVKLGCGDETRFPPPIREAIYQMNGGPFVRFLEKLTGVDHLLPDPHLFGGGMHLTKQGGLLGIHADFNWHKKLEAHRRLNLLLYLTPDWRREYGGELELWDTTGTRRVHKVEPTFNRAVVFSTRSDTFHGHPEPWTPADVNRQSIALYYYTTQRPADEMRPEHSTLYKGYNA